MVQYGGLHCHTVPKYCQPKAPPGRPKSLKSLEAVQPLQSIGHSAKARPSPSYCHRLRHKGYPQCWLIERKRGGGLAPMKKPISTQQAPAPSDARCLSFGHLARASALDVDGRRVEEETDFLVTSSYSKRKYQPQDHEYWCPALACAQTARFIYMDAPPPSFFPH